jgi:hypothetical protein
MSEYSFAQTFSKFRFVLILPEELGSDDRISDLLSCEGEGPGVRGVVLRAGLLTGGGSLYGGNVRCPGDTGPGGSRYGGASLLPR